MKHCNGIDTGSMVHMVCSSYPQIFMAFLEAKNVQDFSRKKLIATLPLTKNGETLKAVIKYPRRKPNKLTQLSKM